MTQTMTLTHSQINTVRAGDRIIAIDGRPVSFVVKAPANAAGAVELISRSITRTFLYPDTHVSKAITVERDVAPAPRPRRKSATEIGVGDRIVVQETSHGLISTTRKTGVIVAEVTGKRKGGGFRCYVLTTSAGELVTPAAGKFTVAADDGAPALGRGTVRRFRDGGAVYTPADFRVSAEMSVRRDAERLAALGAAPKLTDPASTR